MFFNALVGGNRRRSHVSAFLCDAGRANYIHALINIAYLLTQRIWNEE